MFLMSKILMSKTIDGEMKFNIKIQACSVTQIEILQKTNHFANDDLSNSLQNPLRNRYRY